MSYDIDLVVHALPAVLGDPERHMWRYGSDDSGLFSVYEASPTYNYQPALAAAGLSSLRNLYRMPAPQAAEILDQTLNRLLANKGFGDLIKGGGTWGTYDLLVEFLCEFKSACDNNPDAEVRIT